MLLTLFTLLISHRCSKHHRVGSGKGTDYDDVLAGACQHCIVVRR